VVRELLIEVDRGGNQRQVRECLGEVAEQLAARADLLGVEAEVVGVGEPLLEGELGFIESTGAGVGCRRSAMWLLVRSCVGNR